MSYIVPIHRPSGVRNALKLNFLDPNDEALVVAKANRLEVYTQTEDGLVLIHSRTVYGYITILERIRPVISSTDHLFVGTDRYQFFTCSWDAQVKQIKTEQSYFDQSDKVLRDSREMDRCHIDPTKRFMTLEVYDGNVSVIPFKQTPAKTNKRQKRDNVRPEEVGTLDEPVQVRIEELQTRSSAFLQTEPDAVENPRLAILWEDNQETPQLKLRELKFQGVGEQSTADLETVAELRQELDLGVSHLIPIKEGFLILGERTISYVDRGLTKLESTDLEDKATIWTCWTKVDDHRFLLADDYGRLFFLMIEVTTSGVSWRLDDVGTASRAACLVYLDEGFVFVGSHSGDSQVVKIVPGAVEVVQTFPNIAPILDFSIMDLGRGAESQSDFSSGQARIVTASGAWQDGSIRSVRSGVGMEELGTVAPLSHITELWSLSSTGDAEFHDTLVVTFVDESKVLKFVDESVEEVDDFNHFELSQPTLLASNLPDHRVVQVFETGMRISDLESGMLLLEWKPPDAGSKITTAGSNSVHLLLVEGGHTLHVFHTANNDSRPSSSKTFPSQISSVTVPDQSNVCIVAFWQTASVTILDLHSLEALHTQSLGDAGFAIPRSVLVANVLSEAPTLFVAMADGTVVTFTIDLTRNTLSAMTKILLGTEPVVFKALPNPSGLTNIFASCEQPSLIYSSEGRVVYSAVSSDKASRVCYFNSPAYEGAIAIATPDELNLAMIGTERATQLQTLPIGQTVRCLAYEPTAQLFGMGCIRRIVESGTEALLSSVKIADEVNFKELDSWELNDQELVECIVPTGSLDDHGEMFVVGTSILEEDNEDQPRGRIIVFEVNKEKKIKMVAEYTAKTACRSLAMCDGKIIAGLVKTVVLFGLVPSARGSLELTKLADYRTSTNPMSLSVNLATTPPTVAVADLMKSLSVLEVLETDEYELKEVSRHFATLWSSATAATGDNEWVIADAEGNLAMMKRDPDGVTAEDRKRLQITGEFRLGEVVNRIVPIFSPGKGKSRGIISPKAFMATIEGAIYMLGSINQEYTDAMLRLQSSLASKVQAPGYMPWQKYRAWKTEVREADEPFRFVDGEMVEQGLLHLSDDELEIVLRESGLQEMGTKLEEMRAWGEELRRLY